MKKRISVQEAAAYIKDGMTIMVGGFMSNGIPKALLHHLAQSRIKDLTVIANDAGTPSNGISQLIEAGCVKKLIASHIGLNPIAGERMNQGLIEIALVPQGTLAEQIRAGGAGLGGILTPTGIGTEAAAGKRIIEIDGREFILEKPLRADAALIHASIIDADGNIFYRGTTRNFNPLMAAAADLVIAEAEEIVPVGGIAGENIVTPGILIDYITIPQ